MAESPDQEVTLRLPEATEESDSEKSITDETDIMEVNSHFDRGDGTSCRNKSCEKLPTNTITETKDRSYPNIRGLKIKPDNFDGLTDWDEYFSQFEDCAELGQWSENEKALVLASNLSGSARTFYTGLHVDARRSDYRLSKCLRDRFGSTRQQSLWRSMFEARHRELGKQIATLGDDLRRMMLKAYPELNSQAQEALALNQVYKCLNIDMKCRCFDRECSTIADAVRRCGTI